MAELAANPGRSIRSGLLSLVGFWFRGPSKESTRASVAVHLPLLLLALIGALALLQARQHAVWLLVLVIAYFNVLCVASTAFVRYSLPVIPVVILLAAAGIETLRGLLLPQGTRVFGTARRGGEAHGRGGSPLLPETSDRAAPVHCESLKRRVTGSVVGRSSLGRCILGVAVAVILASSSAVSAGLDDPAYVEGYGKGTSGGAGMPTYRVTSSAARGPGSFMDVIYHPWNGNLVQNVNIVFDVDRFTTRDATYIGSNVTIDGCANGRQGVIYDHGGVGDVKGAPSQPPAKRGFMLREGSRNIIIRCLNFIGYGYPGIEHIDRIHAQGDSNFIWLAVGSNTGGGVISNIVIDRNTFTRTTNKAIDITSGGLSGKTMNVTIQRNLFHDNQLAVHVKYANGVDRTRENISFHHNVFVHNGERQPQIVDRVGPVDFVNNIVYCKVADVPKYADGSVTSPYGTRIWNTSAFAQALRRGESADPYHGNVIINIEGNAFLGDAGTLIILADAKVPGDGAPASTASNYIAADNYFQASVNRPVLYALVAAGLRGATRSDFALPWNSQNAIPTIYKVTKMAVRDMKTGMLPYIGAPNRTLLDRQRLDEVAAELPGSGRSASR
jgi:pectate lyase